MIDSFVPLVNHLPRFPDLKTVSHYEISSVSHDPIEFYLQLAERKENNEYIFKNIATFAMCNLALP